MWQRARFTAELAESKESVNTFFAHTEITSEDLYVWSEKPRPRRHHVWLFDPDKRLIMLIGMAVCPAYLTNLHTEDWEDVFLPADMVELIGEFSEGEPPFALLHVDPYQPPRIME